MSQPRPGVQPSTVAPHAMPATPPAFASASASRRPSVGRRPLQASPEPSIAVCPASAGSSPSPWPLTTSSGCQSFWQCRPDSPAISRIPLAASRRNQARQPTIKPDTSNGFFLSLLMPDEETEEDREFADFGLRIRAKLQEIEDELTGAS